MKDGIARVKTEIKGVMGIMQNNISKVLDRGAKLEDLQDKSGALEHFENSLHVYSILILWNANNYSVCTVVWMFCSWIEIWRSRF